MISNVHLSALCDYADGRIGVSELDTHSYISTENMLPNKEGICQSSGLPVITQAQAYQPNDVLVSNIRPYFRKIWFADRIGGCSNDVLVMRAKQNCYPRFLYYILSDDKFFDYSTATGKGTKMPRGDKNAIMRYTVPDIPFEDQKKIANTLSALDDRIAENKKINHHLEQMAQAIFKSWFVDFEPFGGKMPNNWQKKDIYSIADIIYGAPFASKLFNTDGNGKPIIRIRDLKEQRFVTYTPEIHPKGRLIQAGDIVVGMDGEFRPYIWGNDEAWLNQRVCIFSNKRSKGKAFLYCLIKPLLFAIEQTQVATTVIHIGKKDFDAFSIFLPDDETLTAFDNVTDPMIWQIVHNSQENKRLTELRDTLLPRLMSGELSVADLGGGK